MSTSRRMPHYDPPLRPTSDRVGLAQGIIARKVAGVLWTDGVAITFTPDYCERPSASRLVAELSWRWQQSGSLMLRFDDGAIWDMGFEEPLAAGWWASLAYPLGVARPVVRRGLPHRWHRTPHLQMGRTYRPVRPPATVDAATVVEVRRAPEGWGPGEHHMTYREGQVLLASRSEGAWSDLHPVMATEGIRAYVSGRTLTFISEEGGKLEVEFPDGPRTTRRGRIRGLAGGSPVPAPSEDTLIEWMRTLNDARSLWLPRGTRLAIGV